uniref:Uncharacterized protein LOC109686800 n=1 Tax=Castor canadensis TaxID=51338 RepID=A0A8B7UKQ1_CASCN|nr:uncharacterized protein LOC109686800 [Castor canadensis]
MSSHNSRLAADSYKNCVWTISGEAPEFRMPVSCGVQLRSFKAPDQEISGAARRNISQTLSSHGPSLGKVNSRHADPGPARGSPSPLACFLRSRPGVPKVAHFGSLCRLRLGESPWSYLENPNSPLPAPSQG